MKKSRLLYVMFSMLSGILFVNCSDWTEPEAKDFFELPSESYYESLRAYKKSHHQIAFGWYGNWTGNGASLVNSLKGIPDSVDVVSLWEGYTNLTPQKKADLEFCQRVKGTKFLTCLIIGDCGKGVTPSEFASDKEKIKEYWGWIDGNQEAIERAIRKYANALCDTVYKYNYDGFDVDYEPTYMPEGNILDNKGNMIIFIDELSKRLGPKSGTEKLLVLDGELRNIPGQLGPCFNYLINQTYKKASDAALDEKFIDHGVVSNFSGHLTEEEVTRRYVVTENFESVFNAMEGGYPYVDRYGNKMMSLEGMARWQPTNGFEKAGFGCYRMEAEYPTSPEYKWMRNAIQAVNPSLNTLIKK